MFAYYAKWIQHYFDKISILTKAEVPLSGVAQKRIKTINELISELSQVTLKQIDDNFPFTIETDASYGAIAATLSENTQPDAFFS